MLLLFLLFYLRMTLCCLLVLQDRKQIPFFSFFSLICPLWAKQSISTSPFFFSKRTPPELRQHILHMFQMHKFPFSSRYLGLPIILGRLCQQVLSFVLDKICLKTQSWKQKLLSQAGRAAMVQSVLFVIPSYTMSPFLYPNKVIAQMNSLTFNFWWCGYDCTHKLYMVSWQQSWTSKSRGGLDFWDFVLFNLACLAK